MPHIELDDRSVAPQAIASVAAVRYFNLLAAQASDDWAADFFEPAISVRLATDEVRLLLFRSEQERDHRLAHIRAQLDSRQRATVS